jgi:hypothetical protein
MTLSVFNAADTMIKNNVTFFMQHVYGFAFFLTRSEIISSYIDPN